MPEPIQPINMKLPWRLYTWLRDTAQASGTTMTALVIGMIERAKRESEGKG